MQQFPGFAAALRQHCRPRRAKFGDCRSHGLFRRRLIRLDWMVQLVFFRAGFCKTRPPAERLTFGVKPAAAAGLDESAVPPNVRQFKPVVVKQGGHEHLKMPRPSFTLARMQAGERGI
jgi:hypothetical protein